MLLRFGVENHRSIRDRQELSLVSTSQSDDPTLRFDAPGVAGLEHGVLPVVGVYGANASGKSNLVTALALFRDHVAYSFVRPRPNGRIPHVPWRLGQAGVPRETTFDADLLVEGVRHHYGYRFHAEGIVEEWLYRWPHGRRQVVFERQAERGDDTWYFGPSLTGAKTTIAEATRPNSLFLSAAAQFNHEELRAVYAAIVGGISTESRVELRGHRIFASGSALIDDTHRNLVVSLVRAADLGVHDVALEEVGDELRRKLEEKEVDAAELSGFPDALYEVHLVHGDPDDPWTLPPELESRGTQILLSRLDDVIGALAQGHLLVIDELDTSLHPDLCKAVVGLFTSPDVNRNGAQLVFTTHDRDLLTVLRRDEIVLVDKRRDGVTTWAVASDFRDLRKSHDVRKVHAAGRIGGVPILGDLARIWDETRGREAADG